MNLEYRYILDSVLGELELRHNPLGWDEAENILKRSDDFDGVFNNYSLNGLEFSGDGMDYLMELESIEGINLVCSIKVIRFNGNTQEYDTIYYGILNGKTYNELDKSGGVVSINIGESTLTEKFLARKSNIISYHNSDSVNGVDLGDAGYVKTIVQGMEIITLGTVRFEEGYFFTNYPSNYYAIPSVEIDSNNENTYNPNYVVLNDLDKVGSGGWWYNTQKRSSKVIFNFSGKIRTGLDNGIKIIFAVGDKTNPSETESNPDYLENVYTSYEIVIPGTDGGIMVDVDETVEVSMNSNQALFMYITYEVIPPNPAGIGFTVGSLGGSIEFTELPVQVTIAGIKAYNLMERIVESITDTVGCFKSDLLENNVDYKDIINFNGFMARGFLGSESYLASSITDIYDTYKILANAGIGIDDDIVSFESLDNFYKDEISMTIEEVENDTWERERKSELYKVSVETGYSKTEYEEDSGLLEYNNLSEFNTPIEKVDNKASFIPTFRGDGYGITFAIDQNVDDSETTDTQYDQDNFFMDSKKVGSEYVQKGRDGFSEVSGIDSISSPINLNFTPLRLFLNNSEQVTVGMDKTESQIIQFANSDVPNNLVTKKVGDTYSYAENENVDVYKLKSPRFSGFMINFGWSLTFEEFQYIKEHRYEKWKVKNPITKEYHYGWVYLVEQGINKTANIQLIEQYNGTDTSKKTVMRDHDYNLVSTEKNEIISVYE